MNLSLSHSFGSFIFSCLLSLSLFIPSSAEFSWVTSIYRHNSSWDTALPNSNELWETILHQPTVPALLSHSNFIVLVQVGTVSQSSSVVLKDVPLTQSFWSLGLHPHVSLIASSSASYNISYSEPVFHENGWILSLTTGSLFESLSLLISGSASSHVNSDTRSSVTIGYSNYHLPDLVVDMGVSKLFNVNNDGEIDYILGQQVTSLSSPSSIFQYDYLWKLDSSIAVRTSPTGSTILFSHDEFESFVYLDISSILPSGRVCIGQEEELQHIITERTGVYILYQGTIYFGKSNYSLSLSSSSSSSSSSSLEIPIGTEWTELSITDTCFTSLFIPQQYSDVSPYFQDIMMAVSTDNRIFFSSQDQSEFVELVDINGISFPSYFSTRDEWTSNTTVLSASMSRLFARTWTILVDTGNRGVGTILYTYTCDGDLQDVCESADTGVWEKRYDFPLSVNQSSSSLHLDRLSQRQYIENDGDTSVIIRGMKTGVRETSDLFVYGNVFLYSADNGFTFSLLLSLSDGEEIINIETSISGYVVMLTSNSQAYYSEVGSQFVILLDVSAAVSSFSDTSLLRAFIDNQDELYFIALDYNTTTPTIRKSQPFTSSLQTALDRHAFTSEFRCPVTKLNMNTRHDTSLVRDVTHSSENFLPPRIFLDMGDSFSFSIRLDSVDDDHLDVLSAQLIGLPFVDLETVRTSRYNLTSEYKISLSDTLWSREQAQPGQGLTSNTLRLSITNASHACDLKLESSSIITSLSHVDVTVHTGCAPGRTLFLDEEGSKSSFDTCSSRGTLCSSTSEEFTPILYLRDTISGEEEVYEGKYHFEVIGGGPTVDTIRMYSDSERSSFNQGSETIWTVLDTSSDGGVLQKGSSINWVCALGSPCSQVVPSFPHTPEYYLLLNMQTGGATSDSYCNHVTQVVIRLHGLSLDYISIIIITLSSVSILMFLTFLIFLPYRSQYAVYQEKIRGLMESDDESEY